LTLGLATRLRIENGKQPWRAVRKNSKSPFARPCILRQYKLSNKASLRHNANKQMLVADEASGASQHEMFSKGCCGALFRVWQVLRLGAAVNSLALGSEN
jgi:hypothetical protein